MKIKSLVDKIMEYLIIIVLVAMSLIVLWQVFTRFVLNDPSTWSEELAKYLMIWLAFLAGAMGIKTGSHLGLTLISESIENPKMKKIIWSISYILCFITGLIIAIYGYKFMLAGKLKTASSMSFTMTPVYAIIPISGVIMMLNSIEKIYYAVSKKVIGGKR